MSPLAKFIRFAQLACLEISYRVCKVFTWYRPRFWVVGVDEIASMVANIARVLPGSYSVAFHRHPFYSLSYSFGFPLFVGTRLETLLRVVWGPFLLGFLASRAIGVIYVGAGGFLLRFQDGRRREFEWLRRRGLKIVCYFTGADVRSLRLMKEFEDRTGVKTIGGRVLKMTPELDGDSYEISRQTTAEVAGQHADLIFNARVDQMSYLPTDTLPFRYFYPDENFQFLPDKFLESSPWRVLHAPSNPFLKGTDYVREAVRQLKDEGYCFEYIELIGVPHLALISELARAQIVLNEFFALLPGVFGIEALAHTCALLTSADETVEIDLPPGSNDAWLPTDCTQITENLRRMLDNPAEARDQALRGFEWAQLYASASGSGAELREYLEQAANFNRG